MARVQSLTSAGIASALAAAAASSAAAISSAVSSAISEEHSAMVSAVAANNAANTAAINTAVAAAIAGITLPAGYTDANNKAYMQSNGVVWTITESSPGVYTTVRPAYTGPVEWKGSASPPSGGSTSGGTVAAVNGLDRWRRTP